MHVLQYSWFWQYSQLVQSTPQGHSPSQPHTCPQQHSTFLLLLLPVVLSSLPANAITENITATQATKANITDFFIFVYKFDCYTCKDCNNKRNRQIKRPLLTYFKQLFHDFFHVTHKLINFNLAGGGEAAVDFVDWQQGFVGFGKQAVGGSYCQCLGVESFTV